MKKILVTRPRDRADTTLRRLSGMGLDVIQSPTSYIDGTEFELPSDAAAYIVSSVNGVKYGLSAVPDKGLPVFAVGQTTAEAAFALGFQMIFTADGTGDALIDLIPKHFYPDDGKIVHLSGAEIATDFQAGLLAHGFQAGRQVVYDAHPLMLSTEALGAISAGEISNVLFYSALAVTIFEQDMYHRGLGDKLHSITAVALSDRVADAIQLNWADIKVAEKPTEDSLLAILGH